MRTGRPTKYLPEYCEQLIEHMAKGLSYESFAGVLRVSKQTLYSWEKENQDFMDAKEVGVEACRLHWEQLGVDYAVTRSESSSEGDCRSSSSESLNSTVWSLNMRNRFPKEWREKQPGEADVIVNNITSKSDEELDARIKELAQKVLTEGKDE